MHARYDDYDQNQEVDDDDDDQDDDDDNEYDDHGSSYEQEAPNACQVQFHIWISIISCLQVHSQRGGCWGDPLHSGERKHEAGFLFLPSTSSHTMLARWVSPVVLSSSTLNIFFEYI